MSSPSRKLRRFFSKEPLESAGKAVFLSEAETRHLKSVLRLEKGDRCLLTDLNGREAECEISGFRFEGKQAELQILSLHAAEKRSSGWMLRACVAIPQRGKMDYLVEKAQEWGVEELQPLETERTIVKMTQKTAGKVLERWEKVTQEAAKQSGQLRLTEVLSPVSLEAALECIPAGEKIAFFHPVSDAVSFRGWIESLKHEMPSGKLNFFIGPEGGFSDREEKKAMAHGAVKVHLGKQLLKVDTAFLGVLSALRLMMGHD